MNDCLKDIIRFKGSCNDAYTGKFVDNYVQVDNIILANLANENELTGQKYGEQIIESAIESVVADVLNSSGNIILNSKIEALNYDGNFTNETFVNGGVLIRKASTSILSQIQINSAKVKIKEELIDFTFVIDDGKTTKEFLFNDSNTGEPTDANGYFVKTLDFKEYTTTENVVKIYPKEIDREFFKIKPNKTTCSSCSGKKYNLTTQPLFNKLPSNADSTIIPEAYLVCNSENLICLVLKNPVVRNMFLKAVSFQAAIFVFDRLFLSKRLNDTTINIDHDSAKEYHSEIIAKYHELMFGLNFATGIKKTNITPLTDIVKSSLKTTRDLCIDCNSMFQSKTAVF